jgi:predicted dinucleotide-binding enzyme
MRKIGVLGSAVVGQTLARGLKKHDYEVRIGSRDPSKLAEFSAESGIPAATTAELVVWADALVLAVKGSKAEAALREAGSAALAGKIVIDTTNPITDAAPTDGVISYFTGPNESLMEKLQAAFPNTRFVKAFNSVGAARMVDPSYKGGKPTMFYCGNDDAAKAEVKTLLERFGWEPADMGKATAARAIEPLCQLWCISGFLQNSWTHAFHVLWD